MKILVSLTRKYVIFPITVDRNYPIPCLSAGKQKGMIEIADDIVYDFVYGDVSGPFLQFERTIIRKLDGQPYLQLH